MAAILNPTVTVTVRPPAGSGATATLLGCNANGTSGVLTVTTGASGLSAGALAIVDIPSTVITDMDAYSIGQGFQNGPIFCTGVIIVTQLGLPAPPASAAIFPIGQEAQGALTRFGIGTSGPMNPNTTYRFSWLILSSQP